jgi:glycosyltransferase involved in cell wall biosynthesis
MSDDSNRGDRLLLMLATTGRGGAEEYALQMATQAIERGWWVDVAFPRSADTESLRDDFGRLGVRHFDADIGRSAPLRPLHRAWDALRQGALTWRLARETKATAVEIVLPWWDRGGGCILMCAALRIPTAVVFQLMPHPVDLSAVTRAIFRCARARDQHWIAISAHNRNCVAQTFGIAPGEIAVIPNGIDAALHTSHDADRARAHIRQELGLAPDALLAVAVGRLHEQKGHSDVIQALPAIRAHFPLNFAIVGDGPLEAELRRQAATVGVADHVFFVGFRGEVGCYLDAADLFLFPSHFEGLGIALLEAMGHRLPLVVSDAGPLPEVVHDGVHARVHHAGDPMSVAQAVIWALSHPAAMQDMAGAAQARVSDFSESRMADETLALVSRSGRGRPRPEETASLV